MTHRILFLCTGNSCRSQMAEGLLREMGGSGFEVFSAGVAPSRLHPLSIRVMDELGIDIRKQHSDDVQDYLDAEIDLLITLCDHAASVCPDFGKGTRRMHWKVRDPFEGWADDPQHLPVYRQTRDDLKARIAAFLEAQ